MPPRTALTILSVVSGVAADYTTLVNRYTADPSPIVIDGRLWVYASHDLKDQAGWLMTDYSASSTADLVNWRDEGIPFAIANLSWGKYLWAQQVVRNPDDGQFYMFFPAMNSRAGEQVGIGVARAATPSGPFIDLLGKPLLPCGDDPTILLHSGPGGGAVLCGNCNGGPYCGVLTKNLTAFATPPSLPAYPMPNWFEAPWLSVVGNVTYLSYMCTGNGSEQFSHYG